MADTSTGQGPLKGVSILSIEQFGAVPFGTLYLASLGAEVIKVEEPIRGDVSRDVGSFSTGPAGSTNGNLYFQSLNLGKKSLTLDLKKPEGRVVFRKLVTEVDAVASNLRGDVVGKLGLAYEQLKDANPAIICAHLTGYGRDNERASWPGYDYIMQAEAGYCSITGEPGSPPTRFGLSIVDWMAGLTSVIGLLSGVLHARQTGRGGDIDVSLFEVALYNLNYVGVWQMNAGYHPEKVLRGGHPAQMPSQMFKTMDSWIYLMAGSKEKFWRDLCVIIDRREWINDPRFNTADARHHQREVLTTLIDDALSTRTTAQWLALMEGRIPVGPVLDVEQALANPFLEENDVILTVPVGVDNSIRALRNPVRWGQESPVPTAAPALGQHTDEILARAGYSRNTIAQLRAAGAI